MVEGPSATGGDTAMPSIWTTADGPVRSVLADRVYELIKVKLMDNVVEPGARLSIDALSRDMDVSATPIREALARLESDGLVVKRPHRGYTAAPRLDSRAFDELFRMRMLLEPASASWAAQAANAKQIVAIEDLIAAMSEPVTGDSYESYRAFAAQDAAFHLALAEASGVGLMVDVLTRLRPHTQLYRLYYTVGISDDTIAEHSRVIDAVSRRDADSAAAAMAAHLSASQLRLSAAVDR
ncbi:GntR family transcriptional regulator [Actinacidiphila oryziradicis]|uniref:GntR family transcriptional regulator n=2 Tax=Actinacidiphila oryziradicis TaxID=2571141 RepID=A0A4U0SGZ9_9ACTN|nr:GntR family transcriptional regulator [Actinacidiphila oryziradicis]